MVEAYFDDETGDFVGGAEGEPTLPASRAALDLLARAYRDRIGYSPSDAEILKVLISDADLRGKDAYDIREHLNRIGYQPE